SITNNGDNASHVVIASGDLGEAVLDGFTISGGAAKGGGTIVVNGRTLQQAYGGGLSIVYASPLVDNVWLTGNVSSTRGAGVYHDHGSAVLRQVTVTRNHSDINGGGRFTLATTQVVMNAKIFGN